MPYFMYEEEEEEFMEFPNEEELIYYIKDRIEDGDINLKHIREV